MNPEVLREVLKENNVYRITYQHFRKIIKEPEYEVRWFVKIQGERCRISDKGYTYEPMRQIIINPKGHNEDFKAVLNLMESLYCDLPESSLHSQELEGAEHLATIVWTATPRGRDSGASYSDPYNDIRIYHAWEMEFKDWESEEWIKDSGRYGGDVFGLSTAYTKLISYMEGERPPVFTKKQQEEYVGFRAYGHVFKITYISDDSVHGECISGTYINTYEGDGGIVATKGDIYERLNHYHIKGHAYYINNTIYLNGGILLANVEQAFPNTYEGNLNPSQLGILKDLTNDEILYYETWGSQTNMRNK
jgi:hypothetical protein